MSRRNRGRPRKPTSVATTVVLDRKGRETTLAYWLYGYPDPQFRLAICPIPDWVTSPKLLVQAEPKLLDYAGVAEAVVDFIRVHTDEDAEAVMARLLPARDLRRFHEGMKALLIVKLKGDMV